MIAEEVRDYCEIVEISRFFKKILPEQYNHFTFAEMFAKHRRYMLVVCEERIIGCVVGRLEHSNTGYIAMLGVDEEYRHRGLGRVLVESCLGRMHADGLDSVYLETNVGNGAAILLYESLGFKKVALLERYYLDLSPAYRLQLIFRTHAASRCTKDDAWLV